MLLVATVPAGLTAMQALRREAEVDTGYGGRFVESIEGVEGDLSAGRDWFYFVNGIEADRGAAEYRLHPGDVEWWDFRSWAGRPEEPVVVGAFPEPFVHGYGGRRRAAHVRYRLPGQAAGARAIGRLIGAVSVARTGIPVPPEANLFLLETGTPRFFASRRSGASAGDPVRFVLAPSPAALARDPERARYRFRGLR